MFQKVIRDKERSNYNTSTLAKIMATMASNTAIGIRGTYALPSTEKNATWRQFVKKKEPRDASIHINDYREMKDAMRRERSIASLELTDTFFDRISKNLTNNQIRQICFDVGRIATLERLELNLVEDRYNGIITGRLLGFCLQSTTKLEVVRVHAGLTMQSFKDINDLGKALERHHDTLVEVSLENLVVKEGRFANWRKAAVPLLEPILLAARSMTKLRTFQLSCCRSSPAPSTPSSSERPRPKVSNQGLNTLCETSTTLQKLNLSNLGLMDEHFVAIATHLGKSTALTELVLNFNENTDLGFDLMIALFFDHNSCALKTFQAYQSHRAISSASLEFLSEAISKNNVLKDLRVHVSKKANVTSLQGMTLRLPNEEESDCEEEELKHTLEKDLNGERQQAKTNRDDIWEWAKQVVAASQDKNNNDSSNTTNTTSKEGGGGGRIISFFRGRKDNDDDESQSDFSLTESEIAEVKQIRKELKGQGLPYMFTIPTGKDCENSLHSSFLSLGDRSYIRDLQNQKEKRDEVIQEEALEEALELYDVAIHQKNLPPDEELFGMIFKEVLVEVMERGQEKALMQDKILQRELSTREDKERKRKEENEEERHWRETKRADEEARIQEDEKARLKAEEEELLATLLTAEEEE